MARLSKEQKEILKQISRGKYIYPGREYDIRSKAWKNFARLDNEKLIEYEVNSDDGPYYINFKLTIDGQLELEACRGETRTNVRLWVNTAIALIALIIAGISLAMQIF